MEEVKKCNLTTMNMVLYDDYKIILDKIIQLYYYPQDTKKISTFIIKRDQLESIIMLNRDDRYKTNLLKIMYKNL